MKKPIILIAVISIITNIVLLILLAAKSLVIDKMTLRLEMSESTCHQALESTSGGLKAGLEKEVISELDLLFTKSSPSSNNVDAYARKVDRLVFEQSEKGIEKSMFDSRNHKQN